VPSAFVVLEALPLTPNGKIDRKALPVPERADGLEHVAPRTALEEIVADIWRTVLKREHIGVHDNFFELGGHSLLAAQVVARLAKHMKFDVPLRIVFTSPTIESMASWLEVGSRSSSGAGLMVLRDAPMARTAVVFMPTIVGTGVYYARLAQELTDVAVYSLAFPAPSAEMPLKTMEQAAEFCRSFLSSTGQHERIVLAGWSFGGALAYEVASQLAAEGRKVDGVILIDAYAEHEEIERERDILHNFAMHLMGSEAALELWNLSTNARTMLQHVRERFLASEVGFMDFDALLDIYRTNLRSLSAYLPRGFKGELLEIRASDSVKTWGLGANSKAGFPAERRRVIQIPGNHFSIWEDGFRAQLAAGITKHIESI
jgi:thioesterase domain-containing protein